MNQGTVSISGNICLTQTAARRSAISQAAKYLEKLGLRNYEFSDSSVTPVADESRYLGIARFLFKTEYSQEEILERANKKGLDTQHLAFPQEQGQA